MSDKLYKITQVDGSGKPVKSASDGKQYSDADKRKYYASRVKDKSLTEKQRDYAAQSLAKLTK